MKLRSSQHCRSSALKLLLRPLIGQCLFFVLRAQNFVHPSSSVEGLDSICCNLKGKVVSVLH